MLEQDFCISLLCIWRMAAASRKQKLTKDYIEKDAEV